jgi:predicted nucleotidyltransferase
MKNLPADIKRIVSELSKVRGVKAVYLYGSRARGVHRPSSDYDLCVFAGRGPGERLKTRVLSRSSETVDVTLFWDLPPVMRMRVLIDGKPLYVSDEPFMHRAKTETARDYQDIAPMYARYSEKMLAGA